MRLEVEGQLTSCGGNCDAAVMRELDWDRMRWSRRRTTVARGGDAKFSSLRVRNAVLHDLTADDDIGNRFPASSVDSFTLLECEFFHSKIFRAN